MTAEVVVMNRLGVALASDSAVTLPGRKIYNSADKLFLLSETDPVGVMIYGGASFMEIPWETIIKQHRATNKGSLPTVDEHAASLVAFIEGNRRLFPESLQSQHVVYLANEWFEVVLIGIKKELEDEPKPIRRRSIPTILRRVSGHVVERLLTYVRKHSSIHGVPKNFAKGLRSTYSDIIAKLRDKMFGTMPMTKATSKGLVDLIIECLSRCAFGDGLSGLVIAGFGHDEVFPSAFHINIESMALNRIRTTPPDIERIGTTANSSALRSFAQGEMVYSFMEGVDPEQRTWLMELLRQTFGQFPQLAIKEAGNLRASRKTAMLKVLQSKVDALIAGIESQWRSYSQRQHASGILEIVDALPKDELAAMAEALVNLTSFKRRVSIDDATVGGPIDVAVITKGDGFAWIKRKHYFRPELNPRLVNRWSQRS